MTTPQGGQGQQWQGAEGQGTGMVSAGSDSTSQQGQQQQGGQPAQNDGGQQQQQGQQQPQPTGQQGQGNAQPQQWQGGLLDAAGGAPQQQPGQGGQPAWGQQGGGQQGGQGLLTPEQVQAQVQSEVDRRINQLMNPQARGGGGRGGNGQFQPQQGGDGQQGGQQQQSFGPEPMTRGEKSEARALLRDYFGGQGLRWVNDGEQSMAVGMAMAQVEQAVASGQDVDQAAFAAAQTVGGQVRTLRTGYESAIVEQLRARGVSIPEVTAPTGPQQGQHPAHQQNPYGSYGQTAIPQPQVVQQTPYGVGAVPAQGATADVGARRQSAVEKAQSRNGSLGRQVQKG